MDSIKMKFFTLDEANTLLPAIQTRFTAIEDLKQRLAMALIEAQELSQKSKQNGNRKALKEKLKEISEMQKELFMIISFFGKNGIVLRDQNRGVVDFPTIIGKDLGYFCWSAGQDKVKYWHYVDDRDPKPVTSELELLKLPRDNRLKEN